MRLLILDREHTLYAALTMAAEPGLSVVSGDKPDNLVEAAARRWVEPA